MLSITDDAIDERIRSALKDAHKKNKLDVVAAVVAIEGGQKRLREIMNSKDELPWNDRAILGLHLGS